MPWPVVVGRPPRLADAYVDRPAVHAAVENALGVRVTAGITQAGIAIVTGDGGTGKTQIASAVFGHALTPERTDGRPRVDLALWITASSHAAILSSYAQACVAVLPELPGRELVGGDRGGVPTEQAEAFLTWLAVTDRPWLVVLDDVADPADLAGSNGKPGLWPAGPSGRVILTTRRRDAALLGPGRTCINVGVFERAQSRQYLSGKLSVAPGLPVNALQDADRLADDLGHLPVALAQAAAVIINDATDCTAYRQLLADRTRTLTELFPDSPGDAGDDYAHTTSAVWALAAERANALSPAGLAKGVLALAATLDPNGVPEEVFTTAAACTFLTSLESSGTPGEPVSNPNRRGSGGSRTPARDRGEQGKLISAEDARRALRNLHRLSLVTHDSAGGARAVRTHALAQRATIEQLPVSSLEMAVQAVADSLIAVWPDVQNDQALALVLRDNAAIVATRHQLALWTPDAHPVLLRVGSSLGEAGLLRDAITYMSDLASQAGRRLGPDHADTLRARDGLARWRGEAGDPAGAATAFEELLADRLRLQGPDHSDTLATRGSLAYWRGKAGDPATATTFEELLADLLRVLGPEHPDTLIVRGNLAYWRGEAGDPAAATATTEELLADLLRILGPEHPDTLIVRGNLARWRGEAGDPAGAATAFEELLDDRLRVLGPHHPRTLIARGGLAHWRGEAGDPAGAATAFEELLADRLRVLGPHHPDTLTTRGGLARWRGEAGDPAGAATAFEELLDDRLRLLGPDHPDTLHARDGLAHWRGEAGNPAGAATAFEELLVDRLRVLGPHHPRTLTTRGNLAHWRREAGTPTGAATTVEEQGDPAVP
ncbi:MAG: hypothetical protein QOG10_215 [Kribbellaceae bacterium]|nr:hypothetical protein [Kribbellaceae bacterium]